MPGTLATRLAAAGRTTLRAARPQTALTTRRPAGVRAMAGAGPSSGLGKATPDAKWKELLSAEEARE